MSMPFVRNDGGRADSGYVGEAGDCVTRSIAVATGRPYQEVYAALNALGKTERTGRRKRHKSSARNGVYRQAYQRYLESLGWRWTATMRIGSGCKVHLAPGELPMGRLVVIVSKHLTAVIDGVIHDTHDPQRATLICEDGVQRIARRCVYGYFSEPAKKVE